MEKQNKPHDIEWKSYCQSLVKTSKTMQSKGSPYIKPAIDKGGRNLILDLGYI